ncbi:helix-turn-helix transcriptional regulator [Aquipuribacter nitratireducens]|uniref:Helix-turn-helix transcriptional regulator n=1 Tax=Aquipuribacter nitratireducens TaxID=650104 RepID=A0ABW0GID0_9MICO
MSARRTERLLNLVIALRATRRGMRREEIRAAVPQYAGSPSDAAFERMFERDKEDLRELGVPVVTVASDVLVDADDAYRIDAQAWDLAPVSFTAAEVAVLALAARVWQQAALAAPAARALTKLRAVGADDDLAAESAAVRAAAGLVEAGVRAVDRAFDPLHAALRAHRRVRFRYRRPDGAVAARTVDPWRLLLRGGTWYLLGFDHDRAAPRVFRLGRIEGEVTTVRGGPPISPPAPEVVAAAVADTVHVLSPDPVRPDGPRYEALVRVRPGRAGGLRALAERAGAPAGPDGLLRVPWTGWAHEDGPRPPGWLVEAVAACGADATVVAPAPLAEAVAATWQAVLDRHAPAADTEPDADREADHDADDDAHDDADPDTPHGAAADASPTAEASWTPGATDRLSRLLAMVPFVLDRDGIGLAELAAHFEVSEQQVVRDLQLLFVCGTPGHLPDDLIEADWEGGVVRIGNADTLSRPLRLTGEEAVVLLLGLRLLADVPGPHDREALGRATRTLQRLTGDAEPLLEVVADPWGPPAHADTVARALREGRRLRLRYLSAARDELTDREVDPVRVVVDGGRPYLQAWCYRADDVRSFRLDRVVDATVLEEPVRAHPGGDRDGAPSRAWVAEHGRPVRLRLRRGAEWVAEQYPVEVVVRQGQPLVTDVRLQVADTGRVVRLALRLGGALEVLAPRSLRRDVAAAAAAALDAAVTVPAGR